MYETPLPVEQILALLAAAPSHLAELSARCTPAQLRTPPGPDEWSANDVLAHLRACADVWGGCILKILAEDGLTLRAVNPRTWIKQTNYPELEFHPSLQAFTTQRQALLAVLDPLPSDHWQREATVTVAGRPYQRTVLFYAQWLARHERPHLKQIQKTLGRVCPNP